MMSKKESESDRRDDASAITPGTIHELLKPKLILLGNLGQETWKMQHHPKMTIPNPSAF